MPPGLTENVHLSLHELQFEFLAGLRGEAAVCLPEGSVFLSPPRGTAAERWEVYREGYVIRLVEAIRNDYPAIFRILGPDAFGRLIRRYLAAVPPSSYDIGR